MQEQAKHILLVEDDDTNRKLVRIVLGGGRYRISEAVSVEQALPCSRMKNPICCCWTSVSATAAASM